MEKTIAFDDDSFARFIIQDETLSFFIQAKHLEDEIKHTSLTVTLSKEETVEFLKWAQQILEQKDV